LGGIYRPVIKIGPKGALSSHEIHPIHSAPSLGQSISTSKVVLRNDPKIIPGQNYKYLKSTKIEIQKGDLKQFANRCPNWQMT